MVIESHSFGFGYVGFGLSGRPKPSEHIIIFTRGSYISIWEKDKKEWVYPPLSQTKVGILENLLCGDHS